MASETIDRKQEDRELSDDIDQLEKPVSEQTAELNQADEEIQQMISEHKGAVTEELDHNRLVGDEHLGPISSGSIDHKQVNAIEDSTASASEKRKSKAPIQMYTPFYGSSIWLPVAGMFVLLSILVFLDELLDLPHLLLGTPQTPINWQEAIIEIVLITAVGIVTVSKLISDISKRKRAEKQVKHLNLVLRAVRNVNQLITKEKDRYRLLQGICDNLTKTRGYRTAWIALFDESGELSTTAETGLGEDFVPMIERLKRGDLPECAQKALKQSETAVIEYPPSTCTSCHLSEKCDETGAMTVRIEHAGMVYGLLSVITPAYFISHDEEHHLFEEVAGDIAYSLYSIQLDEERKRGGEALRESEASLAEAQRIAHFGNWDWDIVRSSLRWSDEIYRIFGLTPQQFGATYEAFLNSVHPDDRELVKAAVNHALDENEPYSIEHRVVLPDGTERTVYEQAQVYRDDEAKPIRMVGTVQDITERKQEEEERKRLLAELAEKNEELEQIVYVTSHDLRTPLVNVQGFSKELEHALDEVVSLLQQEGIPQDVREKLSPIIEEDIDDSLKYIRTGISKMDSLLEGLLKLSRLGRAALTMEKLDMNELAAEVAGAQEFQIKEKEVKLDIGKLPPCRGDNTQINQAFSNLLDNALKYLDSERPGVIRISGKKKNGISTYCVEDNGIGIAAEHQKKIFEIFHRLNPSEGTGEGLGLTAVRRILDRHKGRIWVESEPSQGSKFFVEIRAE